MIEPDDAERNAALESIQNKPNYIAIRRYGNDIRRLMKRYPNGAPDHIIATALMIDETQVDSIYDTIVEKMRGLMKADE